VNLKGWAVGVWVLAGVLWFTEAIVLIRTLDHYVPVPVATVVAVLAGTVTLLGGQFWTMADRREGHVEAWPGDSGPIASASLPRIARPRPAPAGAGRSIAVTSEAEDAYWRAYGHVAEDVLGDNDEESGTL
jgi:hypothetical protein